MKEVVISIESESTNYSSMLASIIQKELSRYIDAIIGKEYYNSIDPDYAMDMLEFVHIPTEVLIKIIPKQAQN